MGPMRPSSRPASLALQCFIALLSIALVRVPPAAAAPSPRELLADITLNASGPRIAVVVVSQDLRASQQQGALEGAAEAALDRATRFNVIPVHDAFNPTAAKKQEGSLDDSREKMKTGKQALDDLDNVKATEAFTQAVDALKESDLSRNFPALLEAWTMKAAGHATGGENGPAKKDIESVVGLSPRAEFSPTFFPPDLIKFAEAQKKFAANAKGELLVRTEPPGARVWVDGVYRGVSPVTVAGLTGTKHFIAASEGGYALGQSQAAPGEEVISLASCEIGPGWKKATSEIKKDPEGPTRDSAAQTLGKAAQLDQVLLVVSKKSTAGEQLDLIGIRLDVKDGHNASYRTGTVNPGDPEALATFFDGLTGKDAKRDGRDPVHHFKGGGGSPIKTIAGVSLLGLAVVGLGMGIGFGVTANNRAAEWRVTPQTQTFISSNLESEGITFAAVADISYIVALLAAAGGGTLLLTNFLGGPSSADDGKKSADDARRLERDRKAAEDRREAEERAKEDERRREDDKKREEDRRNQKDTDAKAAEEKKKADEEAAKSAQDDEAKKKEDEEKAYKKMSKKERAEFDRKKREEEKRAAAEEKKRLADEEAAKKAEEKQNGKLSKKQKEEEERRKQEEEAAAKAKAEEEARKKAEEDAAAKKKADEERKKREEAEKKKKTEDHDDLRNY